MSISRLLIEVTTLTRKTKQDKSSQRQAQGSPKKNNNEK